MKNINLDDNIKLMERYKSLSQKVRVLTEEWVKNEIYCPNCGDSNLERYPNNKPVADFFCKKCDEDYELKSKSNNVGKKIVDGAYKAMRDRLADAHNPNLFLLNYDLDSWQVSNFFVIPKHFFISEIIEKRAPLSVSARRAGWVGCNILLSKIPEVGRIFFIRNKRIEAKENVCASWQKTLFLREEKEAVARGWLLDVMRCIELIRKDGFTLADVYKFAPMLAKQHPKNRYIKDKIRQQLQILRDRKYIHFVDRGCYRVV
ncbi:type II site-specific deoxyribonuclease [Candidatus Omnitrophus magneticus]|uniref:Type II site-specific deoxyribonuclease n=1 Tax=Candidatus Omnitrophus magneticus TaxID=1609969 RepID=A0A0F0CPA0_9BACT|nr:type II site-specific deoxyribonuclease [Candidatus Omnitrophus magneticus]